MAAPVRLLAEHDAAHADVVKGLTTTRSACVSHVQDGARFWVLIERVVRGIPGCSSQVAAADEGIALQGVGRGFQEEESYPSAPVLTSAPPVPSRRWRRGLRGQEDRARQLRNPRLARRLPWQ